MTTWVKHHLYSQSTAEAFDNILETGYGALNCLAFQDPMSQRLDYIREQIARLLEGDSVQLEEEEATMSSGDLIEF